MDEGKQEVKTCHPRPWPHYDPFEPAYTLTAWLNVNGRMGTASPDLSPSMRTVPGWPDRVELLQRETLPKQHPEAESRNGGRGGTKP